MRIDYLQGHKETFVWPYSPTLRKAALLAAYPKCFSHVQSGHGVCTHDVAVREKQLSCVDAAQPLSWGSRACAPQMLGSALARPSLDLRRCLRV